MYIDPISQLDPVVTVAAVILVGVLHAALNRVYIAPYLRVMRDRERMLEDAEAQLAEAERLLAESRARAEETLMRARERAEALVESARERVDADRRARIAAATERAAARLEEGRAALIEVHRRELEQLRAQALECVGVACDRLLGGARAETIEAAVDRAIARRVH